MKQDFHGTCLSATVGLFKMYTTTRAVHCSAVPNPGQCPISPCEGDQCPFLYVSHRYSLCSKCTSDSLTLKIPSQCTVGPSYNESHDVELSQHPKQEISLRLTPVLHADTALSRLTLPWIRVLDNIRLRLNNLPRPGIEFENQFWVHFKLVKFMSSTTFKIYADRDSASGKSFTFTTRCWYLINTKCLFNHTFVKIGVLVLLLEHNILMEKLR